MYHTSSWSLKKKLVSTATRRGRVWVPASMRLGLFHAAAWHGTTTGTKTKAKEESVQPLLYCKQTAAKQSSQTGDGKKEKIAEKWPEHVGLGRDPTGATCGLKTARAPRVVCDLKLLRRA